MIDYKDYKDYKANGVTSVWLRKYSMMIAVIAIIYVGAGLEWWIG